MASRCQAWSVDPLARKLTRSTDSQSYLLLLEYAGRLGGHHPGATGRLRGAAGPGARRDLGAGARRAGRTASVLRNPARAVDRGTAAARGSSRGGGRHGNPALDRGVRVSVAGGGGGAVRPVSGGFRPRANRLGPGVGSRQGPGGGLLGDLRPPGAGSGLARRSAVGGRAG